MSEHFSTIIQICAPFCHLHKIVPFCHLHKIVQKWFLFVILIKLPEYLFLFRHFHKIVQGQI
jgi:hypothetical protein